MKNKLIIVLLVVLIAVLAFKITFSNAEKANSQISGIEKTESTDIYEQWQVNKEKHNLIFEEQLKNCAKTNGPQKYKIVISDPLVSGLATTLSMDKKTDFEKVLSTYKFASENISYKIYPKWRETNEILKTLDGDCTDKSIVFVSILKNYNIESYVVYGKETTGLNTGQMHAWVAAKIDGNWIQIDPTVNDFYYIHDCLENNCEQKNLYEIAGLFNENEVLECIN